MRRAFRRTPFRLNGALEKRSAPYCTITRNRSDVWERTDLDSGHSRESGNPDCLNPRSYNLVVNVTTITDHSLLWLR